MFHGLRMHALFFLTFVGAICRGRIFSVEHGVATIKLWVPTTTICAQREH